MRPGRALTGGPGGPDRIFGWRAPLRREIALLLLLKLLALGALWWFFFSPAHHTAVDAAAASRRLGIEGPAALGEARGHGAVPSGEQP